MEKNLKLKIIGLERHRGINERATMLGTENLDECQEDKAREYVEYLREQPYPLVTRDDQVNQLRQEVQRRGLIGIQTKDGVKPYLTAEGAINAFREDYPDAGIDLEMIEYDDRKAIFKATITKNVDAGKIHEYFDKSPYELTGGEANLAIKAIFGEIDWDDVIWHALKKGSPLQHRRIETRLG